MDSSVITSEVMGTCVHHWLIDTPSEGRDFTKGVCKKCGAERDDFRVTMTDEEYFAWLTERGRSLHGPNVMIANDIFWSPRERRRRWYLRNG